MAVGRWRVGVDLRVSAQRVWELRSLWRRRAWGRGSHRAPLRLPDAEGRGEGGIGGAVSAGTGLDGPATPVYPCWVSGPRAPARMACRLRKCLKSVLGSGSNVDMGAPKLVFHEQREISKRPERQRMATLGTVAACSQTSRPADQIPAQGGGERYSLCVAHRMRMANAPSRPASVAHHVPLLPHLAWRWDHGADT